MQNTCRLCKSEIADSLLLTYENMPVCAQYFPDKAHLQEDKGVELNIYQCPYCGLIQLLDEPVSYYRDVIRAVGVSEEMREYRTKQFSEFIDRYHLRQKPLIEIGAGRGDYLRIMKVAGGEPCGLEHLAASVEAGRAEGLSIYEGFVEGKDTIIPGGPYEAFYIMNFLEHIPKPDAFLQGIVRNLAPAAVGIVEVPNVDMILEKRLFSEFISDHLMYFTRDTLCRLLELNGMVVLECRETFHGYILSATVRTRQLINVDSFLTQKKYIKDRLNNYIRGKRDSGSHVAVWGAGHQALADLALAGVAPWVDCVIDSAEFKQNKFTPATHLAIVPPEVLRMGKIDTVLIMAAGYSDEVAEIMRKDYPDIEAAILRDDGIEVIDEKNHCG